MDSNWNESNINDLMLYFSFLAERYKENCDDSNQIFRDKLKNENTINFLLKLLSQSQQLTPVWIDIMKFIVQINDERLNSSIISAFLPALRTIPEQPFLYPKFFELYQEFVIESNTIGFDDSTGFSFIQEFIMILINVVDKLFTENVDEYQAVQFASLAWNEIIDYDTDFFVYGCHDEFKTTLLQKFLIILRCLINYPTEFLDIANVSTNNIIPIVQNNINFLPVIHQFLDIIIAAINLNYDEYINNETNRDNLTNTISILTDLGLENNSTPPPLFQYFAEKINQFNDGLIFTIASTSKQINDIFAPAVAERILASDQIPQSALQFVRLCNINVGPQNIKGIITLTYSSFIQNPSIIAIQAICELTLQAPQIFVENAQQLVTPLISWFMKSPPPLTLYVMSCLLYFLVPINPAEPQVAQILGMISKVVCQQARALLQNDVPTMFNFLLEFVQTSLNIIKNIKNKNVNFTDNTNPIMTFFYQMFDQFVIILKPLWNFQSDQSMGFLCKFLIDSIDAKIVRNFQSIINWIGEALYIAPIPDHIELLKKDEIFKLMPTEPIIKFLVSFPQIKDAELQCKVYGFIDLLFTNKAEIFFKFFPMELILSPLFSNDSRLVENSIQFVHKLVSSSCCNNSIPQIMAMIINGMFTNFQETSIQTSIAIILTVLTNRLLTVDQILQMVFSHLKFDSPEARAFQQALISAKTENDKIKIFKAAKKMIVLNHKPQA